MIGACSCLLTLAAPYNDWIIELFYFAKYYNLLLLNDIIIEFIIKKITVMKTYHQKNMMLLLTSVAIKVLLSRKQTKVIL